MPYGLPKRLGGDSPSGEAWMQRCIASVMRDGKTPKLRAILICKAQYARTKGGRKHGSNGQ